MCFSARLVCLMGGVTALGCHGGSLVAGVPVVGGMWFTRLKVDDIPIEMGERGADEVGGVSWHRRSVGTFVFMQPSKFKQVTGFHSDHRRDRAPVLVERQDSGETPRCQDLRRMTARPLTILLARVGALMLRS